jgi:hypothetical protein
MGDNQIQLLYNIENQVEDASTLFSVVAILGSQCCFRTLKELRMPPDVPMPSVEAVVFLQMLLQVHLIFLSVGKGLLVFCLSATHYHEHPFQSFTGLPFWAFHQLPALVLMAVPALGQRVREKRLLLVRLIQFKCYRMFFPPRPV